MAKVENVIRDLIRYHGKRAAKEVLGRLPAQLRKARRDIRELDKQVAALKKEVKELGRARRAEPAVAPAPEKEVAGARFSARSLKSMRRRLDLTQKELAKLLDVSGGTINLWETGRTRPRKAKLARIVALRAADRAGVDKLLGRGPSPTPMTSVQIKRLRKKLGLTQAALAKALHVSPASVAAWETGRTVPRRPHQQALSELKQKAQ